MNTMLITMLYRLRAGVITLDTRKALHNIGGWALVAFGPDSFGYGTVVPQLHLTRYDC
jgi:hypothetical protein